MSGEVGSTVPQWRWKESRTCHVAARFMFTMDPGAFLAGVSGPAGPQVAGVITDKQSAVLFLRPSKKLKRQLYYLPFY